jgi:hypothetical protein
VPCAQRAPALLAFEQWWWVIVVGGLATAILVWPMRTEATEPASPAIDAAEA